MTGTKGRDAPSDKIRIVHLKHFDASLTAMWRTGGQKKKKADKVFAVLGQLSLGVAAFRDLQVTDHGESRIKGCVKYELGDGCRLITLQTDKTIALCFVGDHDDCEHWLNKHSGLVITRSDGILQPAYRSDGESGLSPLIRDPLPSRQALIESLPGELIDVLLSKVPANTILKISGLSGITIAADVDQVVSGIPDDEKRVLVRDVLMLLLAGDGNGAEQRIRLATGEVAEIDELTDQEFMAVSDGDQIRQIKIGSPEHEQWLSRFARHASYLDWLLFMHPEQEAVVREDFNGPAQLSGVSGSGKTCVAVKRAIRLAEAAPAAQILVVTLNRSLAGLIRLLVDQAAFGLEAPKRIKVTSFFELCQELLAEFEPENASTYHEISGRTSEHIDEIFRGYYRCWGDRDDAAILIAPHIGLTAQGISAETYIREEFDWIRSALPEGERDHYLTMQRAGRKYPIQDPWRRLFLAGLTGWEAKMRSVGAIDYLGLTTAVSRHLARLTPHFHHIIVDESQDFGTTELQIVRRLVNPGANDLFLCGDIAQHVLAKHRNLAQAGIEVAGRTRRINRNYRNSRQILKAAYKILCDNLDRDLVEASDLEILDPKYANRSSPEPFVLEADSFAQEFAYARRLVADHLESRPNDHCCIALAGYSLQEVVVFAKRLGLPALDGTHEPHRNPLVLSDLEQTKGYEFNLMVIVNCRKDVLPPLDAPKEEIFRHGSRLYVAMTRARDELYISYHDQPSPWLSSAKEDLSFDGWSEVVELAEDFLVEPPARLPNVEGRTTEDLLSLTGRQFNYTEGALGLSTEALGKIDELIDGRGLSRDGRRVKWPTMRDAAGDLETSPPARRLFGPVVQGEVRQRLSIIATAKAPA
ncbi:MAG TPA: UvrD-helicase domain-containing protein [Stellaceae bacterium]|nr:UvrD-helicase domain-containing protein [Stellaceae bacterium]